MMICQRLLLFLKKWITFGKFIGCKAPQKILIYLYGISKVDSGFNGPTSLSKLIYRLNFLFSKIKSKRISYFLLSNLISAKNINFR